MSADQQVTARMVRFDRFGGDDVLHVSRLGVSAPDALQVSVAVAAAGVNPVDVRIRSGRYPGVGEDRLPYTLGRDVAGVVVECGAQAEKFSVGDAVFGMVDMHGGGYAERVVVDQHALTTTPAGVDAVRAGSIPTAGLTAWQGLFRYGRVSAGSTVLVQGGTGGVGHFAIQFAKAAGARVIATTSTPHVAFARELGADVVIDYETQDLSGVTGVDVVLDLVGGAARAASWAVLVPGGVLVTTRDAPSEEEARAHGVRALRFTVEADGAELAEIAGLVAAGTVTPHISATHPLEQAAAALTDIESGHTVGKVVLEVDPGSTDFGITDPGSAELGS